MLDLVIHGGAIANGTGSPRFKADVGIENGVIVVIGNLADAISAHKLDAAESIVAPGFIDIHSHSDFTLLVDSRAQSSISQGVTTELIGNCGHGCAPITEPDRFTGNIYGYTPEVEIDWETMAEYLDKLEAARPAVNVATLVPNGNLRLAVVDELDRPSTPQEVSTMGRLLEESFEAGAFDAWIALGQAERRTHLSVERLGVNLLIDRDANGLALPEEALVPGAPAAYFARLPIALVAAAIRRSGSPAQVSDTAGTYVCNEALFAMLHALAGTPEGPRAGFIHLPYLPEQTLDKRAGTPSMALESQVRGVRAAL